MHTLLVRNVRLAPTWPNTAAVDVLCRDGLIALVSAGISDPHDEVIDGNGEILIAAFSDVHAHLDSTRLGLPFRPHTADRTLESLIENDRSNWRSAEMSVTDRATYTLGRTIAAGATRVRSHAQVDPQSGLDRLEGVLAAREAHRDRAIVEIVAFPQAGILREQGTPELLDEAMAMGADLVGGLDPEGYDGNADGHLDVVFAIAAKHHAGVDIHLHDRGEIGVATIENICRRALTLDARVNISHCFGLVTADADTTKRLVETLAVSGVTVTTVAPGTTPPMPLRHLEEAGVAIGLGQDGTRDYWSPYGNGDMLDRTWQLAFTNGFRKDADIEHCLEVATAGGAKIMGIDNVGLEIGSAADLVVVPGDTVTAAVMDRALRSFVIRAGRVVARGGELV
ncbi:MAG TPA: amidohydrolase [Acidimicrobiia bacterium]